MFYSQIYFNKYLRKLIKTKILTWELSGNNKSFLKNLNLLLSSKIDVNLLLCQD